MVADLAVADLTGDAEFQPASAAVERTNRAVVGNSQSLVERMDGRLWCLVASHTCHKKGHVTDVLLMRYYMTQMIRFLCVYMFMWSLCEHQLTYMCDIIVLTVTHSVAHDALKEY